MGFINAVSLLVVFSLVFFNEIADAVPSDRENITGNGGTFTSPSNVTGESDNHTSIHHRIKKAAKEIKNHTNTNIDSSVRPILDKKALAGQENNADAFKNILQQLQVKRGMKMQDLKVLLLKLGLQDCSRDSKVKIIQDF
jgi:hypothetical protein